MDIDISKVWEDYQMGEVQKSLGSLFPEKSFNLEKMLAKLMTGDVPGAVSDAVEGVIHDLTSGLGGIREVFVWIMVLGIAAALISHFIEIFDSHQIADIGFYFTYLLMSAVLLRCFMESAAVAADTIEKIVEFVRIFIPAYFLSVGVAAGSVTATAGYQIILLIVYLVEQVLLTLLLPLIYSYVLLALINGLWTEERLALLVEGMEKAVRFLLRVSIGLVTGVSAFQSMITPAIDSVKAAALQKTVAAIPGVGNVADGVMEVVLGSAVVIKNSIGMVLLLLLLVITAVPLLKILFCAVLLKAAAAFWGLSVTKGLRHVRTRWGMAAVFYFRRWAPLFYCS